MIKICNGGYAGGVPESREPHSRQDFLVSRVEKLYSDLQMRLTYNFFCPGLDETPLPPPPAHNCVTSAGELFITVYKDQ